MEFLHKSVLLTETINSLKIKPDGIYVDGTAGGAGHSAQIAKKLTTGRLIAIDQDPDAIKIASERLAGFPATVVQSNFKDMKNVLKELKIDQVDGILLDLGVSSWQLDNAERGFSYHNDAPLDMRMSQSGIAASDLVNNLSPEDLADIFRKYGEEKFAYRIALAIEKQRQTEPVNTTLQLAEIISNAYPAAKRRDGHPARKCFQALRIEVNKEFESLEEGVREAFSLLKKDGILSVITFHSLEDRMVKRLFEEFCTGCTCPNDFPVCMCGKKPQGRLQFKKPIIPSDSEIAENPRSRSAKLRAVERTEN
ncbi:MAG: 16S rRNA (cytosine(1402)-N(4))-methyltransferase RsmH [Oscillospiraceae bacterium]